MDLKTLQPGNGYQLPPEAYYTEEWLAREQKELFACTWNFVCTTDDLPKPGAYKAVDIGNYPIALVHGEDGVIRAFHNLCRHRGAKLLSDSGTCDKLKCPYHFWQYSLSGELKSVPQGKQQIPLMDKTEWGLLPVPVGIWMGMIFINPDGKAKNFESWLGDMPGFIDTYKLDELTELACIEYTFDANWKFYIENHIDWYHLWYTHQDTLSMLNHPKGYMHQLDQHWISYEPYKDTNKQLAPFKPIPWLNEESQLNGAHLVFPNLTLFSGESWFGTGHITPVGPDKAKMSFRLRALPGQDPSQFLEGFHQITQVEDAAAASLMQAAVKSPAFSVGPLTKDYEKPITHFHDAYLQLVSL